MERDPDTRVAFLDQACEGDRELRREVDRLLAAHEGHDTLLDAGWLDGPGATTPRTTVRTTITAGVSTAAPSDEETWTSRLGRYVFPRRSRDGRVQQGPHERAANRL